MDTVYESRIKGVFKGFKGGNIYKLVNGSKWKQAYYRYRDKYKYRPRVKIFRDGTKYYLEVEGIDEKIEVRRVY